MSKKLGLALGSGAPRGLAHIGVLKALDEAGVKVDAVAGTSMGAVIAALYACGYSGKQIEELALTTQWHRLIDFTVPKTGFIAGRKLERYLRKILKYKNFEDLEKELYIVATEVNKAERVVFSKGDIAKALKASVAIPGIMHPVKTDGMLLVDGGAVDPVPVDVLKEKRVPKIIAVDLSFNLKHLFAKKGIRRSKTFTEIMKEALITSQIDFFKNLVFEGKIKVPSYIKWIVSKMNPEKWVNRIMKLVAGRQIPEIVKIYTLALGIATNELSRTKLRLSNPDIIINPGYGGVSWEDFHETRKMIKLGYDVAKKHMHDIRKLYEK